MSPNAQFLFEGISLGARQSNSPHDEEAFMEMLFQTCNYIGGHHDYF